MKKRTYGVFLSFAMVDGAAVDQFRRQVLMRLPVAIRDHSIKGHLDNDWKRQGEAKLRRSSVIICLVGEHTYQSDAVAWEIRKGVELGKGVMAVYLDGGIGRLPRVLEEFSIRPVRWDVNAVMSEIRRVAC